MAVAVAISALTTGSVDAGTGSVASSTRIIDAAGVAAGMRFVSAAASRSSLPQAARDAVHAGLKEASGTRISVSVPPAEALLRAGAQPRWSSARTASTVNGIIYVIDRSADFRRLAAHLINPVAREVVTVSLTMAPDRTGSWVASWISPDGTAEQTTIQAQISECSEFCINAGIATTLIAGLACLIVIPFSWVAGAVVCVFLGAVVGGQVSYACDSLYQACDDDPTGNIYHLNLTQFTCDNYWSCDVKGIVGSHRYNGNLLDFGSWLEFWYNSTEYAYQVYDEAEMGLRQTLDYSTHQIWQFENYLQPEVPRPYCAYVAKIWIWADFGYPNGASIHDARPKPFSDSCRI